MVTEGGCVCIMHKLRSCYLTIEKSRPAACVWVLWLTANAWDPFNRGSEGVTILEFWLRVGQLPSDWEEDHTWLLGKSFISPISCCWLLTYTIQQTESPFLSLSFCCLFLLFFFFFFSSIFSALRMPAQLCGRLRSRNKRREDCRERERESRKEITLLSWDHNTAQHNTHTHSCVVFLRSVVFPFLLNWWQTRFHTRRWNR